MKLNHKIFTVCFSLFLILFFSNCDIVEISETTKLPSPDLNKTTSGITVTLKNSMQDIEFVNIYRQEVTGFEKTNEDYKNPIVNIGIIYPLNNNSTFFYEDNLVYRNRKYRYCARISDKIDGFVYTNWSSPMLAENGIPNLSDNTLKYTIPGSTQFKLFPQEAKIEVKGVILSPNSIPDFNDNYVPALVFKTEKGIQVFEISDLDNSTIYLTKILPISFYNTEISFLGIIGQKKQKIETSDETEETVRIIWTDLTEVQLYEENSGYTINENKFTLEIKYGETGYDYSF